MDEVFFIMICQGGIRFCRGVCQLQSVFRFAAYAMELCSTIRMGFCPCVKLAYRAVAGGASPSRTDGPWSIRLEQEIWRSKAFHDIRAQAAHLGDHEKNWSITSNYALKVRSPRRFSPTLYSSSCIDGLSSSRASFARRSAFHLFRAPQLQIAASLRSSQRQNKPIFAGLNPIIPQWHAIRPTTDGDLTVMRLSW